MGMPATRTPTTHTPTTCTHTCTTPIPSDPYCSSSEDSETDESSVEPTPIEGLNPQTALPSSEIQKEKLRSAEDVLTQYKALTKDVQKAGSLAVKLAHEAVFSVHEDVHTTWQ